MNYSSGGARLGWTCFPDYWFSIRTCIHVRALPYVLFMDRRRIGGTWFFRKLKLCLFWPESSSDNYFILCWVNEKKNGHMINRGNRVKPHIERERKYDVFRNMGLYLYHFLNKNFRIWTFVRELFVKKICIITSQMHYRCLNYYFFIYFAHNLCILCIVNHFPFDNMNLNILIVRTAKGAIVQHANPKSLRCG